MNNTDNNNFVFNSQVNNNYEKSKANFEIDCNHSDIYDSNFAQKPADDFSNSAKSNGAGLSFDLNSCNMDTVNNLDD